MSIRVVQEVMVVMERSASNFQRALNDRLEALDRDGKNVADIRYHMACHGDRGGDTVTVYTALILVGG